jgi:hypothetical protein
MPTRDLLLRSMRGAATSVVEEVTGREVVAYLTHNDFRRCAPVPCGGERSPSTSSATIDFDTQATTNRIVELMRQRTGRPPVEWKRRCISRRSW